MDLADERQKQDRPIRILQVVTYMGRGGIWKKCLIREKLLSKQ